METPKEITVLLIQPPVMKRIDKEESIIIEEYFNTINNVGNYLGDSPLEPNYGLLSIAASIREWLKDKISVNVILKEFNYIEREIREKENRKIEESDIRSVLNEIEKKDEIQIIGLSFMTVNYGTWGLDLIQICKDIFPTSYIFLGGIHPTLRYKAIYEEFRNNGKDNNFIDGIVIGEGERVFCDIIEYVNSEHTAEKLNAHPHIYRGDSSVVKKRTLLNDDDLSNLPIPAYDLLPNIAGGHVVRIYTTRGCSNNCSFCSANKLHRTQNIISRSAFDPNKIINSIRTILTDKKYQVRNFVLGDLSFLNNRAISKRLLVELHNIRKAYNIDWWCQCRADDINPEAVDMLKKVGFTQIAIGCEAATNEQLQYICKGETVENIKHALTILRDKDMQIQGYWILGLPHDTETSIKATQTMILDYLKKDLVQLPHITILVPYPGCQIEKHPKGISIISTCKDEDYWMNCDEYGCGKPVYNTIDSRGNVSLSSDRIYGIWLETLQLVTNFIKNRK
jgi:radical SAM superfamily enzyme YgiQ (UPF0313 family)